MVVKDGGVHVEKWKDNSTLEGSVVSWYAAEAS